MKSYHNVKIAQTAYDKPNICRKFHFCKHIHQHNYRTDENRQFCKECWNREIFFIFICFTDQFYCYEYRESH